MASQNFALDRALKARREVTAVGIPLPHNQDDELDLAVESLAMSMTQMNGSHPVVTRPALSQQPRAHTSEFHVVLIMSPGPARDAMALGLWDAGMLVTTFASPHEAEGVLIGERVHVVLVDWLLGATMGPLIVHWLHATGRGSVRVVVFGETPSEVQVQMVERGVAYCVPRPSDPGVFARQLGSALGFAPIGWR